MLIGQVLKYLIIKREKAGIILELKSVYDKLINRPLKEPSCKRKRLANCETASILRFLVDNWFVDGNGGDISRANAVRLLIAIKNRRTR